MAKPGTELKKVFAGQPPPILSARLWNSIIEAVRIVFTQVGSGRLIPGFSYRYFRITSAERVAEVASGPPIAMWRYTGEEVVPVAFDADEYELDRYKPKAGGLEAVNMYNDSEERDPNYSDNTFGVDAGFAYGNGIKAVDLPEGFVITPVAVGRVVRAYYTLVAGGAEWRFDAPNGITGACPEGEGSGA